MSEEREEFMRRVKRSLQGRRKVSPPARSPSPPVPEPLAVFERELAKLNGELIRASDLATAAERLREILPPTPEHPWFVAERDLAQQLAGHLPLTLAPRERMADCLASITEADYLIADTATVGLRLDARQPRTCHLLPEVHVVVARAKRMVPSLANALRQVGASGPLPAGLVFVTGPSRTADIEKTIVIPAHGPKRLIVVLLEESPAQ